MTVAGEVYNFPLLNGYVVGVHYDEPTKAAATGATAGSPGGFTPLGCEVPEDLSEMAGLTATPATAWTLGQYVNLGDGSFAHWSGTAWATGAAPAEEPEEPASFDPAGHTVAEVLAYVEDHPDERQSVAEAEEAGKGRTTLLDALEAE